MIIFDRAIIVVFSHMGKPEQAKLTPFWVTLIKSQQTYIVILGAFYLGYLMTFSYGVNKKPIVGGFVVHIWKSITNK